MRSSASVPHASDKDLDTATSISARRPVSRGSERLRSTLAGTSSSRPTSAISRPLSRTSTARPSSRQSGRSRTRQSARLVSLSEALVTSVTGLDVDQDEDNFQTAVAFVSKNFEYSAKAGPSSSIMDIDTRIRGHAQKARIQNRAVVAEALEIAYKKLKIHLEGEKRDLDQDIQYSKIPEHLQLLMLLSRTPTQATVAQAYEYLDDIQNPLAPPKSTTWQDIFASEPLEGQHWQGAYGLPPGSVHKEWSEEEEGSSGSEISSASSISFELGERDVRIEIDSASSAGPSEAGGRWSTVDQEPSFIQTTRDRVTHRRVVEELQSRQYWRPEWKYNLPHERKFDMGDASTLGPSTQRALGDPLGLVSVGAHQQKYIPESDGYREILMALQDRSNLLITRSTEREMNDYTYVPSPTSPRFAHLSVAAQWSIIGSFAELATTVSHLRAFVRVTYASLSLPHVQKPTSAPTTVLRSAAQRRASRTQEAFAEAVDAEIRALERWCADREEAILRAQSGLGQPLVISLLSLERDISTTFGGAFIALLDVLRAVVRAAGGMSDAVTATPIDALSALRTPPARLSALFLNTLLGAAQDCSLLGDSNAANVLFRVFVHAVEPLWEMAHAWLRDGMHVRTFVDPTAIDLRAGEVGLDDEFFIEDNELSVLDPDFWADGYILRSDDTEPEDLGGGRSGIPSFLVNIVELVLGAGKAVGLLRALGMPTTNDVEKQGINYQDWISKWRPFEDTLAAARLYTSPGASTQGNLAVSTAVLSSAIYDEIAPACSSVQATLAHVVIQDCELWYHLYAMEDLYLMRRGDVMSEFADVLFARIDSRSSLVDFHFLNTAFHDSVEKFATSGTPWIQTSLVRISGGRSGFKSERSVQVLDELRVEYDVPFPLSYILGPKSQSVYGNIFVLLLQIRRVKFLLDRVLVSGSLAAAEVEDLKVVYAMRSKLAWFVGSLYYFVTTNVLHVQLLAFHEVLRESKSVEELINLHNRHLEKVETLCLLRTKTSGLHRAILSILDICIYFSDCFNAFTGDATANTSRKPIILTKRHRSRRLRQQRRDIVGFSQSIQHSFESDTDTDSDVGANEATEPSFSVVHSTVSFEEEGFDVRLDRMATELDGLVRFLRRGVEGLATGVDDVAPVFGTWAFALDDWDK